MEAPPPATGVLGRCRVAFYLALFFDAAGLALLLVGVFVDVSFSDLLIYGGGVGIFFSLLWWVFWYAGNLEVPPAELQDDVGLEPTTPKASGGGRGRGLARRLVRSLSRRLSGTLSSFPSRASGSAGPRGLFSRSPTAATTTTSDELELEPT